MRNLIEYNSFLFESMSKDSAIENLVKIIAAGSGWIDPDHAVEIFSDLTGLEADSTEADEMLKYFSDLNLLYYEKNGERGEKVDITEITSSNDPHHFSDDNRGMYSTFESDIITQIKKFDEFLFEGGYDKLTGEISSALMRKIKETTGKKSLGGVKIEYGPSDEVPSFYNLIEKNQYLEIGHFIDEKSGIDVRINLTIVRDESPDYTGKFVLDGETDDESSVIYIYLYLTPGSEPNSYSEIASDLRNLIRHEIEHLTQRGWGEKRGKGMRRNETIRRKIQSNSEFFYKYYKLKDEIPANLHGLHSEAKTRKITFADVVHQYLDKKIEQGVIPKNKKSEIYRIWKSTAEKIGGLPPL